MRNWIFVANMSLLGLPVAATDLTAVLKAGNPAELRAASQRVQIAEVQRELCAQQRRQERLTTACVDLDLLERRCLTLDLPHAVSAEMELALRNERLSTSCKRRLRGLLAARRYQEADGANFE